MIRFRVQYLQISCYDELGRGSGIQKPAFCAKEKDNFF